MDLKLLNRDDILGADDLKSEIVAVPEWRGSIRVRVMTGAERDAFRTATMTAGADTPVGYFSAALLAATIIDKNGERLFSFDDIMKLQEKSATALDGPAKIAMRINGMSASAIDDAEKNLGSSQSADSGSDLQKN